MLGLQSEMLGNIRPINVWVCKRHVVATYTSMRDSDKVRQMLLRTLTLRRYKVRCVKVYDPTMLSRYPRQLTPALTLPPPPAVSQPSLAEAPVEVPPSPVECTFIFKVNLVYSFLFFGIQTFFYYIFFNNYLSLFNLL